MTDNRNSQPEPAAFNESEEIDPRILVENGKRVAAEALKDAKEIYSESLKQVTELVRKHPLEAMAIGFGVGCLVGVALARR